LLGFPSVRMRRHRSSWTSVDVQRHHLYQKVVMHGAFGNFFVKFSDGIGETIKNDEDVKPGLLIIKSQVS